MEFIARRRADAQKPEGSKSKAHGPGLGVTNSDPMRLGAKPGSGQSPARGKARLGAKPGSGQSPARGKARLGEARQLSNSEPGKKSQGDGATG